MGTDDASPPAAPAHGSPTLGAWRRSPAAAGERALRHRMLTTQQTVEVDGELVDTGTPLSADVADDALWMEGYR